MWTQPWDNASGPAQPSAQVPVPASGRPADGHVRGDARYGGESASGGPERCGPNHGTMPGSSGHAQPRAHVPVPASGVPEPANGDLKDDENYMDVLLQGEDDGNGSVPVTHQAQVQSENENGVNGVSEGVSCSADTTEVVDDEKRVDVEGVAATLPEATQEI